MEEHTLDKITDDEFCCVTCGFHYCRGDVIWEGDPTAYHTWNGVILEEVPIEFVDFIDTLNLEGV